MKTSKKEKLTERACLSPSLQPHPGPRTNCILIPTLFLFLISQEPFNIKQESLDSTDPIEQPPLSSQAQSRSDDRAALKREKKAKSARKQAKWNFKKREKDATGAAQEELDRVQRRIKQEEEEEGGAEWAGQWADSSWDDSSGLSSSEWSSVGEVEDETDGYLTSASARSTSKKRKRRRKKSTARRRSGHQSDRYDSETGGETDGERSVQIKVEDTMDALLPGEDSLANGTETRRKRRRKTRLRVGKFCKKEQYLCKQCAACLLSYESYLKHLKSVHQGYEISTLCYICGFSSSKRSTLAHHIQDHIQPRQKQKQICEICCAEVYHINGHIKDKHSGFFLQCPHCPKRFPRKTELTNHIKGIHLKHELRQAFVCEYCNKEFTFLQYLKRHMRTHTNEKPYKCVCGLGFNFNVSLKNHKQKCSVHLLSLSMQQQHVAR